MGLCGNALAAMPEKAPALTVLAHQPQNQLHRTTLSIRMHQVHAQLANTPSQREHGLMFTPSLPETHGMLFIFPSSAKRCFWMKNTLIPLDAAFINEKGHITNIAQMQPLDETSHCSTKAVSYVLEVNRNWFEKRKIVVGDKVFNLPPIQNAK